MDVNLAAGQECLDAEYVYNHATFGTALDVTLDNILIVKRGVDTLPALAEAGFLVRKDQLTFLVFLVLNVNFYLVADFQIGIVAELACRNDTVTLVTDVYDNFFFVCGNNCSLDNLMLTYLVQGLVVSLVKLFFADIYM